MLELDEQKKEKNLALFAKRLESIGVDTSLLMSRYGTKIKEAPMSTMVSSNVAYDGALLERILRVFTPRALQVAELLDENIRPSKEQIIKVCLLHKIALALILVPNTNEWEIKNRGYKYVYAKTKAGLKIGMRSVLICNECGIQLTEEEMEAMLILDRAEEGDAQAKFFSTPLSIVIKLTNELFTLENRLSNVKNED